jgi:hypothetical protein
MEGHECCNKLDIRLMICEITLTFSILNKTAPIYPNWGKLGGYLGVYITSVHWKNRKDTENN